MNKLLLGGIAVAAILSAAPAVAQPTPAPAPVPAPQVQIHMEHKAMRAQTRDQVVAYVRETFARFDANHDGYLTKAETDAGQAMAGDIREHFARQLADRGAPGPDRTGAFDRLDTNHDGVITRDEFVNAQPQINERRVIVMRGDGSDIDVDSAPGVPGVPGVKIMRMHGMGMGMGIGMHGQMFEMADANHDGRVSLQEMTKVALQHFDSADANHDGTLSPEERMQMHQQMKGQRMQPA